MPIVRVFRGRKVKRTKRIGDRIVVFFHGANNSGLCTQVVVPRAQFLAERQAAYEPGSSAKA